MRYIIPIFIALGLFLIVWLCRRMNNSHAYARGGWSGRLGSLLKKRPAAANDRNSLGETPLHHAARYGEIECMQLLLESGADVNASSVEGATALHFAAGFGETAAVEFLLTKGATPDPLDATGMTPVQAAQMRDHSDIVQMLVAKGADANRPPILMQDLNLLAIPVASDDPLLIEARNIAKATMPEFRHFFADDPANCSIKFPLETDEGVEHVWGRPLSISDSKVITRLISQPIGKPVKSARSIDLTLDEIEDWQYIQPDNRIRGAFTMLASFKRILERNGQLPPSVAESLPRYVDYKRDAND